MHPLLTEEAGKKLLRTKTKAKFVETNLRAFELGFAAL